VAGTTIRHALDLQRLRMQGERAGCRDWTIGVRPTELLKAGKRSDAMTTSSACLKTATEIERTIKTSKRYEQILASYLILLTSEQVHQLAWLSPTDDSALRLCAIVLGIRSVTIQKRRFAFDA
jgi:hypothetical protein